MKILLLFYLILPLSLFAQDKETIRISTLFNFDWKFQAGDIKDAPAVNCDDSNWRKLDLPHDFQIEQPWDKSAGDARGYKALGSGWYRKSFKADPAWKKKKVLLDFEGVMLNGQVWFNGQKIVDMDYGYLGYEADITKHINYDGDNLVAVYATTKGNSRWYTGGGLFRDVHLVVKDTISIARHGVFITTPANRKEGSKQNLFTYTNAEEVELLLKDKSGVVLVKKHMGKKEIIEHLPYQKQEVYLTVVVNGPDALFSFGETPDHMTRIGGMQSLEAISDNAFNKFNGPGVGIYATSNGKASENKAVYDWFEYVSE